MKLLYCLLLILCPYISLAQLATIKPLAVGDQVPDIRFTQLVNSKFQTANLSQFKGKLLILDFWATWCSSCIKKFNLLDSFQRMHPGKLQVILVSKASTGDTKQKLFIFFSSHFNAAGNRYSLPVAYNDTLASAYFPHVYLPHYVWISPAGNCLAVTGADELTTTNINTVLQGKIPPFSGLALMNGFDFNQPLFTGNNAGNGSGILSRSTLSSFIPGMASMVRYSRNAQRLTTQFKMINTPLLQMIKIAYGANTRTDRIIFQLPDTVKACLLPHTVEALRANSYTYELICPPTPHKQARLLIQQDINRYFGIQAKKEMRPTPCYLLTADTVILRSFISPGGKKINNLYEKQGRYLQNGSLASLALYLNTIMGCYVKLGTTVSYNLDIKLPDDTGNDEFLIQALAAMGIILTPSTEITEQFIIYQSPKQQL